MVINTWSVLDCDRRTICKQLFKLQYTIMIVHHAWWGALCHNNNHHVKIFNKWQIRWVSQNVGECKTQTGFKSSSSCHSNPWITPFKASDHPQQQVITWRTWPTGPDFVHRLSKLKPRAVEFAGAAKMFLKFFWVALLKHFAASFLELPAFLFFLFQCIPVTVRWRGCDFN